VTDTGQIAGEAFAFAKDNIYPKVEPTAIPVIDHFVDLRPSERGTKAPTEIRMARSTALCRSATTPHDSLSADSSIGQVCGWRRC
jgi:hypothetical protein